MKVTFHEVGQGDTITIDFNNKQTRIFGIIDCKSNISVLPDDYFINNNTFHKGEIKICSIINYLRDENIKDINFLVSSHPHEDHISGIETLLKYCYEKNIIIEKYFHTFEVLSEFKISNTNKRDALLKIEKKFGQLSRLTKIKLFYKKLRDYEKTITNEKGEPIIKESQYIEPGIILISIDNYIVKFISPSGKERKIFNESTSETINPFDFEDDNDLINLISSLVIIEIEDNLVILNSDAMPVTFDRLLDEESKILENKKSVLVQLPHHGSEKNYVLDFFKYLKKNSQSKPKAVISSGKNEHYKHPSTSVIESLIAEEFDIYSTNFVHGIKELIPEGANKRKYNGDKVFIVNSEGITSVD